MMIDNDQAKKGPGGARGDKAALKTTDLDSPYYLHPSDDPGKVLVTSPLTGENFHTWRRAMQNALYTKNKMGFIDGTLKKPSADCPEFLALGRSVTPWLMNLCQHVLMAALVILNMEPLPSLNKVYSMATKEEKQQMVSASRSPAIEATALAAKTSYNRKVSTSGKPRCDHYKRIGHTKERCYEIIGYPVSWKPGQTKMRGKGEQQKHQNTDKDVIFAANASLDPQMTGGQLDQSPITGLTKAQYDQLLTLLGGNSDSKQSINLAGPSLEEVDWNG
ncbi:hypothetical protein SLEP1_g5603 [Rubroshorea leprosula]|uniref:Retrotransposon Copia-like N-terminal domain-containing protein n=1 Tax=Rubroshorea leprosula TaxID=152421 RepID=A0AAV5I1B8_9ROSI|nr:hypothetical protein SLEP1_g5603 [Rubroshorea leprosula]